MLLVFAFVALVWLETQMGVQVVVELENVQELFLAVGARYVLGVTLGHMLF